MKTIKFRAWDKKSQKMRKVRAIDFFEESVSLILDESEVDKEKVALKLGINIDEVEIELSIPREFKDVEIMQFTGLKVKGIEIYESDLVELVDLEGLYEIIFEKDYSRFACKNIKSEKTIPLFYGRVKEVLGNIYENQELLKGSEK